MTELRRLSYVLGLVLGATIGPSSFVYAKTIDLFCQTTASPSLNVSIDPGTRTASAFAIGFKRGDVPAGPAIIADDQVTWTNRVSGVDYEYALDRQTGVLTQKYPGTTIFFSCKKSTPVF